MSKATVAMVEQVLAVVGERRAELAVHHVDNPGAATEVAATLAGALPGCGPAVVTDLGPVLGVHLGPGAVGVVLTLEPD
jgi:fatty acid-binding protein DegV